MAMLILILLNHKHGNFKNLSAITLIFYTFCQAPHILELCLPSYLNFVAVIVNRIVLTNSFSNMELFVYTKAVGFLCVLIDIQQLYQTVL